MWLMLALAMSTMGQDPVLPRPKNSPTRWIKFNDYTAAAMRAGQSALVEVDLSIGVDGKPLHCRGRLLAGDYRPFIAHTCSLVMKRAAFEFSVSDDGSPIQAGYRATFVWTVDTNLQREKHAGVNALVPVASLPVPPEADARVVVRRIQAADGAMESCRIEIASKSPALDRLACPAVADSAIGTPILDAAGTPVRGVRYAKVQFVEGAGER